MQMICVRTSQVAPSVVRPHQILLSCSFDKRRFLFRIVNALELKDHLDKQTKTLSVGLKRKVRAAPRAQLDAISMEQHSKVGYISHLS